MKTSITKFYKDVPFAHRQPKHDGPCRFIHGHNWTLELTLAASAADANGFVLDFGKMKFVKDILDELDHTTVLNSDDPLVSTLAALKDVADLPGLTIQPRDLERLFNLVVLPDCSCEGLAAYLFERIDTKIRLLTEGRVWVEKVTVFEDWKNSATVTK